MEFSMPNPGKVAYDSFGHNINTARWKSAELTVELGSRFNSIPLLGTRRKKRIKAELQQVQERIADYEEAQRGILAGDYTAAVKILLREADRLTQSETTEETGRRVAREPATLGTILNSPQGIATRMRQTAHSLESLNS